MLTFFSFLISGVILDRFTKYWASLTLPGNPIDLWPRVLRLQVFRNETFLFSPIDASVVIFVVSLLVLLLVAVWGVRFNTWSSTAGQIGYALVFAGAGSNLFDRLFQGYILDFLRISDFTVINLADVLIVVGLLILLVKFIKKD
jgi:signal peptidase II